MGQTHRQKILEDLRSVNERVDKFNSDLYTAFGKYSYEEIVEEFGTWKNALDEAGVSMEHKLIEDVRRLSEELDGKVTCDEYYEYGKFSKQEFRNVFGSWNKFKQAAGLEINQRKIPEDKLGKDMKRVAESQERPMTLEDYSEKGKYSSGVFSERDFTFGEFRDKLGLEEPEPSRGYPSKDALKAWYEEMKDVKGRFGYEELKERLSSTGYNYSSAYLKSLQSYFEEKGFQFSVSSGGNGSKYYIKGPEAPSLEEYYQQFLDKIPDDKEDWFMESSGAGVSPKSIVAGIRYLTEDKTQAQIAAEEDVTEVTVRKSKKKIIDRFDLDRDSGRNITTEENSSEGETPKLDYFVEFFTSRGFDVVKTKENQNFLDIYLRKEKKQVAVFVRLNSKSVEIQLIKDIDQLISSKNLDYSVIISENSFEPSAIDLANEKGNIELLDLDEFDEYKSKSNDKSDSLDLIKQYSSDIGVGKRERVFAKKIARELDVDKSNSEIAAACICVADAANQNNLSEAEVAENFGITGVSLQIMKQEVENKLDISEIINGIGGKGGKENERIEENKDRINEQDSEQKLEATEENQVSGSFDADKLESEAEKKVLEFFKRKKEVLSFAEVSAEMELHRNDISEAISSLTDKNLLELLDDEDDLIDYYRINS